MENMTVLTFTRYVLSPTHLHEFKSADHIHTQQPVMSLCLLDQRLGSRSAPDASSPKFSLKGRQSGGIHRGHSWVFRAESYDTMMAWYEDIRNLTEKSGSEKTEYVRRHARSVSAGSQSAPSISSDGVDDDEADEVPYAANKHPKELIESPVKRPSPGGRFPSDININHRVRDLQSAPSQSSGSSYQENEPMMTSALAQPTPNTRTTTIEHGGEAPQQAGSSAEVRHSHPAYTNVEQHTTEGPARKVDPGDLGVSRRGSESPIMQVEQHARPLQEPAPSQSVSEHTSESLADAGAHEDTSGARSAGRFPPSVPRHDTATSVGEFHMPGGWTRDA